MLKSPRVLLALLVVILLPIAAPARATIVIDGVGNEIEWTTAASVTNSVATNWGSGNHLDSLKYVIEGDFLYILVEGAIASGQAIVLYLDNGTAGAGVKPFQLTDEIGALDAAVSANIDLAGTAAVQFAWGTLDMNRSVTAPDSRMGWRDIFTDPSNFYWLDSFQNMSACGGGACEMRILLSLLGGSSPYSLFARITDVTGTYFSNQCLPEDDPNQPELVSQWFSTPSASWKPAPRTTWQVQLTTPVNTSWDVEMYDIDLFDATQSEIDALHADGRAVIAHFRAGVWENWRPDAGEYPVVLLGNNVAGYPSERWVDIRNGGLLKPLIEARLDLAAAKGFDGVEPADVDAYLASSGFPLTPADQLAFNRWLAIAAHARGLSVGLKNDQDQVSDLAPWFDWALAERIYEYGFAATMQPFLSANKAVFGVEYTGDPGVICPLAEADGISVLFKTTALGDEPPGGCQTTPVAPEILAVSDVTNDQGRQVRVAFQRSGQDNPGTPTEVLSYELYRRIDPLPTAVAKTGATWDLVTTRAAHGDSVYYQVVPTLADSTAANGIHWSVFFVRAVTSDPFLFYDSLPDSGYSVDNLAPSVPTAFAVAYRTGSGNQLSWDPCPDADFQYFKIYRSSDPGFIPSPSDLVHSLIGTSWADPAFDTDGVYYKVTALDFGGNESDPATPETVTAVAESAIPKAHALHPNVPNPFNPRTTIRFELAHASHAVLQIFDVAGRLVTTLVNEPRKAGAHEVSWGGVDANGEHVASGVYLYRLHAGEYLQTRRMVLLK